MGRERTFTCQNTTTIRVLHTWYSISKLGGESLANGLKKPKAHEGANECETNEHIHASDYVTLIPLFLPIYTKYYIGSTVVSRYSYNTANQSVFLAVIGQVTGMVPRTVVVLSTHPTVLMTVEARRH